MLATRQHYGLAEITAALETIKPGDKVEYGSLQSGHSVGLSDADYRKILLLVAELEERGHIMRFTIAGYYVAFGVTPRAKMLVESWAASASWDKLPLRKKKRR